ncbi:hypothetical protein EVAR_97539_1 [Eumeta japonica]|uniref:Uncharacterized protein n=1 Tax=Eumeta variegata TaxID=151549 RepID=A0A4C1WP25_EUMVA|nr:hypothetical protein EVAR_97539_1 [Eumeta japonica]
MQAQLRKVPRFERECNEAYRSGSIAGSRSRQQLYLAAKSSGKHLVSHHSALILVWSHIVSNIPSENCDHKLWECELRSQSGDFIISCEVKNRLEGRLSLLPSRPAPLAPRHTPAPASALTRRRPSRPIALPRRDSS